ncbi:hypothetical protein DFO55_105167 [Grimontella sp. AG753]|nr:hypothetical protein DFO55_105167 [Grimontella sp. AG753]
MWQQCPKEFVMKAEELDRTVLGVFFRVRKQKMGVKQSALKREQAVQRLSAPPEKKWQLQPRILG